MHLLQKEGRKLNILISPLKGEMQKFKKYGDCTSNTEDFRQQYIVLDI